MTDYIAFGPEWEKELMRFRKTELIGMIRDLLTKGTLVPVDSAEDDEGNVFSGLGDL